MMEVLCFRESIAGSYQDELVSALYVHELSDTPGPNAAGSTSNGKEPLISALRRSAEEYVSKDWVAVGEAIDKRLKELGWRQRQLAERSKVSQAVIRELQHHTLERRRSSRTLEALSNTLGWHPQHLEALANGQPPPEPDEPVSSIGETLWTRLDDLEERLDERLNEIEARLDALKTDLATVVKHVRANR